MRWRTWLSRRCSSPRGPSYDTAPAAAPIADPVQHPGPLQRRGQQQHASQGLAEAAEDGCLDAVAGREVLRAGRETDLHG
ncbi:hypothetical protein [Streptomyces coeruleorubidus]|uniref:Uncharacterized protein n=1 Tax=Streptomyces coeruleorubidus TaxID=116188 RepID=A0ABZ0KNJ6_STRC4|nr:hypothetical protein [Streptomyces coeruleorubidus]WOT39413.1 hypothetical protein R5U08_37030 [Streptomyces coeruleorubidus]